jgi:hypothetical protein
LTKKLFQRKKNKPGFKAQIIPYYFVSLDYFGDFWIVKLRNAGSIEWKQCYGETSNDGALSYSKLPTSVILLPDSMKKIKRRGTEARDLACKER